MEMDSLSFEKAVVQSTQGAAQPPLSRIQPELIKHYLEQAEPIQT